MRPTIGTHYAGLRSPQCIPEVPLRTGANIHISSTFLDELGTGLWVAAYTEPVVRACAALLLVAHSEYHLLFVPTYIIDFARELGSATEVSLDSRLHIREELDFFGCHRGNAFHYITGTVG